MICSNCQTRNEAGRKFCMECGARLATGCPNCGAQNPEAAKFCGECGTALAGGGPAAAVAPAAQPIAQAASERRLVTVLFADLVGFTTLAEGMDAEDTREFLTRYFEATRTIVERYGGTVEKFIGDAVMAVWGAPTAHEDDAERAVRAALDVVGTVPSLSEGFDVQVRAGVLTGEAAVTIGASGQGMVAGDIVNTASRLQSVAPPGSVLVGEATYRAAGEAVTFEPAGEQLLKGKEAPVPAWRAAAVVGLRGGSRRSEALEPPFTGRDEELRLLKDLFHATEREHKARLVSVIGQAGIGKSRLAWEFEKYIDGVVDTVWWHNGRSPAYGDGISYWALAEMVRGRAGIAESDEPPVARGRLAETVAEWVADEADRGWIEQRLAALLALEPMPPGSRDEVFAAWRTFFERIAARGPTVLVFEDLQWADEGMIDFVEELLDRSRNHPLFVVTLARPELLDRRPGWGSAVRAFNAIRLEPLEAGQMAEMVRGTVPGIPDETVDAIVARAEGVPLYAVETVRMLLDRGQLRAADGGRFELTGPIDRLAVPETLHALVAARLDALDDQTRRLAQTAAVLGQSFTLEAISAVSGQEPDGVREHLDGLVRRQFLSVDVDPRSPERGQYKFIQGVVKEVAEQSLARADRRTLHLAAARYFESLGDDELAGVLASHYVEAYAATPPGPEADALAAQARVSLRAAAERAAALHSYAGALAYLERALTVTSDPAEQAALHERAALAATNVALIDAALAHAVSAEELWRGMGDRLGVLRAITVRATTLLHQHSDEPAIELLRPALRDVEDLPVDQEVVRAQGQLARALMIGARSPESIEWCDRVLRSGAATDEQVVETLITKGTAQLSQGAAREGEVLLRGAIVVAERLGLIGSALRSGNNLVGVLELDDLDAAEEVLRNGYRTAQRFGLSTWMEQFALTGLSAAWERGRWDEWIEETGELELSGFYRGWRAAELLSRAVMRGERDDLVERRAEIAELIGTSSTQAKAGMATSDALFAVAAGDWAAAMPLARIGWAHFESRRDAVAVAIFAGTAAGEPSWIREAKGQLDPSVWTGRYPDGIRAMADAGLALVEGRWSDGRSQYLAGRRLLTAGAAGLWAGMLDLSVGERAAGRFPEAHDAARAADEFFASNGAQAFVATYRSKIVRPSAEAHVGVREAEAEKAALAD